MNAIERLRKAASGERAWAFLGPDECSELLQETDRLRADTREACARICDERAKEHVEATRSAEAESCAAAIRAAVQIPSRSVADAESTEHCVHCGVKLEVEGDAGHCLSCTSGGPQS